MAITLKTLTKEFTYQENELTPTDDGFTREWSDKGQIKGILSAATMRELTIGQQQDLAISHTLVVEGPPQGKVRGRLLFVTPDPRPDRIFSILRLDNPGELDLYTFYYLEELFD